MATMTDRDLQAENDALRAALREQWEWNHAEHCTRLRDDGTCPNTIAGYAAHCFWPLPTELGGPIDAHRTYDMADRRK